MEKRMLSGLSALALACGLALPVSAHVVVKPAEVGVAKYQTFTVGVPNEKDVPTTKVRLVIPAGLKHVTPNVKPGWKIEVVKDGTGHDALAREVIWSEGSIPLGQRDEFLFSAQVPAEATSVQWKAYQTYQNGAVVSWDQAPVKNMTHDQMDEMEKTGKGPYSETRIINDLAVAETPEAEAVGVSADTVMVERAAQESRRAYILSLVSVVVALGAVIVGRRRKASPAA